MLAPGTFWSFSQTSGISYNLHSIFFTTKNLGWCVGKNGTILKTENGGGDWILIPSISMADFESVFFANEEIGWVTGKLGTILKTLDGGNTWTAQDSKTIMWLRSIYFINDRAQRYHKSKINNLKSKMVK